MIAAVDDAPISANPRAIMHIDPTTGPKYAEFAGRRPIQKIAVPSIAIPRLMINRAPNLRARLAPIGVKIPVTIANGNVCTPEESAE